MQLPPKTYLTFNFVSDLNPTQAGSLHAEHLLKNQWFMVLPQNWPTRLPPTWRSKLDASVTCSVTKLCLNDDKFTNLLLLLLYRLFRDHRFQKDRKRKHELKFTSTLWSLRRRTLIEPNPIFLFETNTFQRNFFITMTYLFIFIPHLTYSL